jgi:hypothetical protein
MTKVHSPDQVPQFQLQEQRLGSMYTWIMPAVTQLIIGIVSSAISSNAFNY